jgi:acyl-CoA reductase-like NAD-dependent aldehyde dehydrogenase
MAIWKIGPALAAGNTIVLKPSELTPLTTVWLAELAADLLPDGTLNVITGHGDPVGAGIVSHPAVRMVSLTGSGRTGKAIAKAASDTLARVHLELGGKAPVVVLDDADVDAVVAGARLGAFFNAGQDCTAATRVIATPGIHDALVEALVPAAASLRMGDPIADPEAELGPVISDGQRARALGFVERADAAGATVATGGNAWGGRGFFVEPTVIVSPAQEAEIVQDEVFGPVVTVQRAADEAQGAGLGQRHRLRAGCVDLDPRCRRGAARSANAELRLRVDQRAPSVPLGDAARRLRAVRLQQGSLALRLGGVHPRPARDGVAPLSGRRLTPGVEGPLRRSRFPR